MPLTINQEKEIRRMKHRAAPSRQMNLEALATKVKEFRVLQRNPGGPMERRKAVISEIDWLLDELKIP